MPVALANRRSSVRRSSPAAVAMVARETPRLSCGTHSQELDGLLDTGNTCNDVFADSAYRSTKIEGRLRASGFKSRIHRRATRNHPLSNAQLKANRNRSKIRARIEHVFGAQESSPGGRIVRTIGIVRARAKIGLQNLAYNIRRLVTLERIATA